MTPAAPRRGDLPYSIEAERSVLGGALLQPEALATVTSRLGRSDFYFEGHRLIWDALAHLVDTRQPATLPTACNMLAALGAIDQVDELTGGAEVYLTELQGDYLAPIWVEAHCAIVREYADRRRQIEQGAAMVRDGFSGQNNRRRGNGTGGYE